MFRHIQAVLANNKDMLYDKSKGDQMDTQVYIVVEQNTKHHEQSIQSFLDDLHRNNKFLNVQLFDCSHLNSSAVNNAIYFGNSRLVGLRTTSNTKLQMYSDLYKVLCGAGIRFAHNFCVDRETSGIGIEEMIAKLKQQFTKIKVDKSKPIPTISGKIAHEKDDLVLTLMIGVYCYFKSIDEFGISPERMQKHTFIKLHTLHQDMDGWFYMDIMGQRIMPDHLYGGFIQSWKL